MFIYSIGGGEIIYEVLKAVTFCLNGGQGILEALLRLGGFCGAFVVYFMILYGHPLEILKRWGIPVLLMTHIFFLPTSSVIVKDTITNYAYKIDNVPYGLAVFASQTSQLGKGITELVEQCFSTPDDMKYQKTGMMFGSDILEKAKTFKITNRNFKENMRNFVGQCVKYDIMLNQKYSFDDLRRTNDIWGLITSSPSENRGLFWIPIDGKGEVKYVTCKGAALKFNEVWEKELSSIYSILGEKFLAGRLVGSFTGSSKSMKNSQLALENEIKSNLANVASYLGGIAEGAEDVLKQALMINAIGDAASENSKAAGNAITYAEIRSLQQQNNTFDTIGRLAAKLLPMMKAVIEALAYACFIFVIPLSMIPQGYKFLLNWAAVLVWLQAWPPMYAILNYIMNIAARAATVSEIGTAGGLTIANYIGVSEANAEMKLLAGYLSISIPFICIAVVKGVGTFVHLASQMTGTSVQAAGVAAGEVSSGNFSFGNVSMRNQSYDNVSQLQRNYSSSLSAGGHVLDTGGLQIKNDASGFFSAHRAVSSGVLDFATTRQSAEEFRRGYSDSMQRARNAAMKLSETESVSDSETASLSHSLSQMSAHEISDRYSIGADNAEQIRQDARVLDQYHTGKSYTDQTKFGANGSGGLFGKFLCGNESSIDSTNSTGSEDSEDSKKAKKSKFSGGFGFNLGGSIGGDADSVNALNASHMKQSSMSNDIAQTKRRFDSSMESIANSNRGDEVSRLAATHTNTLSKVQQLSDEKTYHENQARNYQESYNRANSLTYAEKVNLRDSAMEIAMKECDVTQGEAIRIMDSNNIEDIEQRDKWFATAKERRTARMSPTMPAMRQPMNWEGFDRGSNRNQIKGEFDIEKSGTKDLINERKNEMTNQEEGILKMQSASKENIVNNIEETKADISQTGEQVRNRSEEIKQKEQRRSQLSPFRGTINKVFHKEEE